MISKRPETGNNRLSPLRQEIVSDRVTRKYITGLLAGLWEFPTLELDTLDSDYKERAKKSTQYLNTRYQLEFKQPNRFDLGNVVHLFSHIRKVYHIEWIQYEQDDLPTIDCVTDVKWVTLTELKTSPIPTGLKKALKLLENFKVTKRKYKKYIVFLNLPQCLDYEFDYINKKETCEEICKNY